MMAGYTRQRKAQAGGKFYVEGNQIGKYGVAFGPDGFGARNFQGLWLSEERMSVIVIQ